MSIVEEYKKAISLRISGAVVDCANEVFWKIDEEYECPKWLREDEDFMTDVLDYCEYVVGHIDWSYGIGSEEWEEIASEIAKEYCLKEVML